MFGKNTYLHLPQVSSSLHSRAATSVVDLNGNEIQLHDMLSGHYLTTANAPVLESTALFNNNNNFNHDVVNGLNRDPSPTFPTKQAVKKDRHSKIYTSQGPRDRRVRLSIGIARKFFDLQEMLGFDKPSKTLDWLLTKSKTAIKELVQSKSTKSNTSSPCDDCEEVVSVDSENVTDHSKGKSLKANNKCKEAMDSHQAAAKELRAKARARARERTKEKMCIKQLNEAIVLRNHQFEVSGTREAFVHPVFGFHQQNYGNTSHENWDQSNFASQSNQLCAILNQHKFIN